MGKLSVGQTLIWVPYDSRERRNVREVTVLQVGRKWARLSNHYRIDVNTLIADDPGYSSPGECYLNKEEYEATLALRMAWQALRRDIDNTYIAPPGVSLLDIKNARELLKI